MKLIDILNEMNPILRILLVIVFAVASNFAVKAIRRLSQHLLTMKVDSKETSQEILIRKYPRLATIITIFVSAMTFTIYFVAVGMILREFKISLTTYFASATVIGLAVGFGLQGFVQDVVIGLTLIFTDALNIGEMVKLGDEIGKVDSIGLRYTVLINLHGQRIIIPNRNIATIASFAAAAFVPTSTFKCRGKSMKRRCPKRFRQSARACTTNTDLSFWPHRKCSGSRMSRTVNGVTCASSSSSGRDK
ncbi:MAG: mechanosensitive ion channel family protein [Desulfobacterales bacterium]|jgi:small conductance mechanosensitive channel